ncbi:unnamed protein product, partial [Rotaria sp. Silwood2]
MSHKQRINMLSIAELKKKKYQRGDTKIEFDTNIKRYYDGNKWRRLCAVYDCDKTVQTEGLCARHLRKFDRQQRLPIHLSTGDFILINQNDTNSEIRDNLEHNSEQSLEQNIISSSTQEISMSSHRYILSTDQTNVSRSSITILSENTSTDAFINNSNTETNRIQSHYCQYQLSSINMYHCQSLATYKCSHCSVSFCLQHGLKHQEDLKKEIRDLLMKTQ